MASLKIKIYTTPTCAFCHAAKEFFREHGVAFEEHDVATDEVAREAMIKKSGQLGVPVIEVDDKVVVGFHRRRLAELLGIKEE